MNQYASSKISVVRKFSIFFSKFVYSSLFHECHPNIYWILASLFSAVLYFELNRLRRGFPRREPEYPISNKECPMKKEKEKTAKTYEYQKLRSHAILWILDIKVFMNRNSFTFCYLQYKFLYNQVKSGLETENYNDNELR